MPPLEVLRRLPWWLVLIAVTICSMSLLFIHSATSAQPEYADLAARQTLFLCVGAILGLGTVIVPYARAMRYAWVIYFCVIAALLALPLFGSVLNGARRWYRVFGFGVQPSEFAKLAVILVLASWLRFRAKARTFEGLLIPILITAVPVGLIMMQPDLGSSLVFWPVLLAVCYAAGTRGRTLLVLVVLGLIGLVAAYFTVMHEYQQERVEVWLQHFSWDREAVERNDVTEVLRDAGYQPWQSLIAIGSGGMTGFGYMHGPQSQFDFLPYRSGDYLFSVVAEETGLLGALTVLGLQMALVVAILAVAARTRERFGRLLAVGVATYLGTQTLLHIAVCAWMVPATGLPMPLFSYGGSSTLVALLSLALVLNVAARRVPVLAADGYL